MIQQGAKYLSVHFTPFWKQVGYSDDPRMTLPKISLSVCIKVTILVFWLKLHQILITFCENTCAVTLRITAVEG